MGQTLKTSSLDWTLHIISRLDFSSGKIYWASWGAGKIQRANFDGSNLEDLVVGLSHPAGIALDGPNGKMYWTHWLANAQSGKIQRADLDGSNVEDLVTTASNFFVGIALGIPQIHSGLRFDPNMIADQTFTVWHGCQPQLAHRYRRHRTLRLYPHA